MSLLFNTYVIDTDNFKAVKRIAEDVDGADAQEIEYTAGKNYDSIDYFVQSYEVGSERDLECSKELKKLAKAMR